MALTSQESVLKGVPSSYTFSIVTCSSLRLKSKYFSGPNVQTRIVFERLELSNIFFADVLFCQFRVDPCPPQSCPLFINKYICNLIGAVRMSPITATGRYKSAAGLVNALTSPPVSSRG